MYRARAAVRWHHASVAVTPTARTIQIQNRVSAAGSSQPNGAWNEPETSLVFPTSSEITSDAISRT